MFWKNKPLPKDTDRVSEPIEDLKLRDVYKSEIKIPEHLLWKEQTDVHEITKFLDHFYKPTTESYIKYILSFKDSMVLSIMSKKKNIIYGLIGGYGTRMHINDKIENFVNVSFICVHSDFRKKNMSSVMIEELTRRYIEKGYNYGCFMTNKDTIYPVCKIHYYDRIINYEKMKSFIKFDDNVKEKHFAVYSNPSKDYQLARLSDYEEMFSLYNKYIDRFNISIALEFEEFKKYFTTNDFIRTYVIYKEKMIDFLCIRLYEAPYKVAELMFYTGLTEPTGNLINETIKIGNSLGVDVIRVPNEMNTGFALLLPDEEEKANTIEYYFMKTNKINYFCLYNWKLPQIAPKQLAFIIT
jgi:hypothetical protein